MGNYCYGQNLLDDPKKMQFNIKTMEEQSFFNSK